MGSTGGSKAHGPVTLKFNQICISYKFCAHKINTKQPHSDATRHDFWTRDITEIPLRSSRSPSWIWVRRFAAGTGRTEGRWNGRKGRGVKWRKAWPLSHKTLDPPLLGDHSTDPELYGAINKPLQTATCMPPSLRGIPLESKKVNLCSRSNL